MNALGTSTSESNPFVDNNGTATLPNWYVPGPNDVIFHQGISILNHQGNLNFQALIALNKVSFANISRLSYMATNFGISHNQLIVGEKQREIAESVVQKWRNLQPMGKFLLFDDSKDQWIDIGNERAVGMTLVALGEDNLTKNVDDCIHRHVQNIVHGMTMTNTCTTTNTTGNNQESTRSEEVRDFEVIRVDDEHSAQEKGSNIIEAPMHTKECLEIIFSGTDVVRVELPETTREGPLVSVSDIVLLPSSAIERLPSAPNIPPIDADGDADADGAVELVHPPTKKQRIGQSYVYGHGNTGKSSRGTDILDKKTPRRRIEGHGSSDQPKPSSPVLRVERLGRRKTIKSSQRYMIPHNEVTKNDVLYGKGGQSIHHCGNIQFRKWAEEMKPEYSRLSKSEKIPYSWKLVRKVWGVGGRFLEKDEESGKYYAIIKNDARLKASQALREEQGEKK